MIMSLKQRKIKFEPRIKLNHNIYVHIICSLLNIDQLGSNHHWSLGSKKSLIDEWNYFVGYCGIIVIRLRVWFKGLLSWGKLIMISQLSQFVCWFQLSPWCHILIVQSICFWHNWCWYGKIPEKVSKGPVVWVKKKKRPL